VEEIDSKVKYTTIHIPQVLASIIDDLIRSGEFAYSSRSEFVKDALRRYLEEHGYYPRHSTFRIERSTLSMSAGLVDAEEERAKLKETLTTRIKHLREFVKYLEESSANNTLTTPNLGNNSNIVTKTRTQK
jgi:Arc/MetJ-type ribon-helix-helix transcriptional regulator